jgi:hypothetical protein
MPLGGLIPLNQQIIRGIMETKDELIAQLFTTGKKMRIAQRAYFNHRQSRALKESKKNEAEFDRIIDQLSLIISEELQSEVPTTQQVLKTVRGTKFIQPSLL